MEGRGTVRVPRLVLFLVAFAALIYVTERLWQLFSMFADLVRMLALAWLLAYVLHPLVAWLDRGPFPEPWLEGLIRRGGTSAAPRPHALPDPLPHRRHAGLHRPARSDPDRPAAGSAPAGSPGPGAHDAAHFLSSEGAGDPG